MTPTKLKVLSRGLVVVKDAHVHIQAPEIVAVWISLGTKYADVQADINSERDGPTLSLGRTVCPADEPTLVCLPEFVGWDIWCSTSQRYSVYVCLVKPRPNK